CHAYCNRIQTFGCNCEAWSAVAAWSSPASTSTLDLAEMHCCTRLGGKPLQPRLFHLYTLCLRRGLDMWNLPQAGVRRAEPEWMHRLGYKASSCPTSLLDTPRSIARGPSGSPGSWKKRATPP